MESQLLDEISDFKTKCVEDVIWKLYPNCDQVSDDEPQNQFEHLASGYLVALGDDFCLKNTKQAQLDKDKEPLNSTDINKFRSELEKELNYQLVDFAVKLADKWNDRELQHEASTYEKALKEEDNKFNEWLSEHVGEVNFQTLNSSQPFFYDEDRKDDYILLNKKDPNLEQESLTQAYFKPIEILEILKEFDWVKEIQKPLRKDIILQMEDLKSLCKNTNLPVIVSENQISGDIRIKRGKNGTIFITRDNNKNSIKGFISIDSENHCSTSETITLATVLHLIERAFTGIVKNQEKYQQIVNNMSKLTNSLIIKDLPDGDSIKDGDFVISKSKLGKVVYIQNQKTGESLRYSHDTKFCQARINGQVVDPSTLSKDVSDPLTHFVNNL